MIITINNLHDMNKVSLHDAYFEKVIYNHEQRTISIDFEGEWKDSDYKIKFQNVLYYEMTCCDFWGPPYDVACWHEIDTIKIFDKLLRINIVENARSRCGVNKKAMELDLYEYFGVEILLKSGDRLKIICKEIEVAKV